MDMSALNKRPKKSDTGEDIMKMAQAFYEAKSKHPSTFKPAAFIERVECVRKGAKKSIFAKQREKLETPDKSDEAEQGEEDDVVSSAAIAEPAESASNQMQKIVQKMDIDGEKGEEKCPDIEEQLLPSESASHVDTIMADIKNILGEVENGEKKELAARVIIGDVVERKVTAPKAMRPTKFTGKSRRFFNHVFTKKRQSQIPDFSSDEEVDETTPPPTKSEPIEKCEQKSKEEFNESLFKDLDEKIKKQVNLENLKLLGTMPEKELQEHRMKLLGELAPSVLKFFVERAKKKQLQTSTEATEMTENMTEADKPNMEVETNAEIERLSESVDAEETKSDTDVNSDAVVTQAMDTDDTSTTASSQEENAENNELSTSSKDDKFETEDAIEEFKKLLDIFAPIDTPTSSEPPENLFKRTPKYYSKKDVEQQDWDMLEVAQSNIDSAANLPKERGVSQDKVQQIMEHYLNIDSKTTLPPSNPAIDILKQSYQGFWMHFNTIEKDKLSWLSDIPMNVPKPKPGEEYEARFNWKGMLLPYSAQELQELQEKQEKNRKPNEEILKDDRDLYLHGDDPHRPGYTLQEYFRLARSTVPHQRIAAISAIGGILHVYNHGYYDRVLELPISKIFFLLRYALDDKVPGVVMAAINAIAFLFYNHIDEMSLDLHYNNFNCHWQPLLTVVQTNKDIDDPTSIENLQKQMAALKIHSGAKGGYAMKADVEDNENGNEENMSDFELAETDLVEFALRSNILQRCKFIFLSMRPTYAVINGLLKILIRLARTKKEVAQLIVDDEELMDYFFNTFMRSIDTTDINNPNAVIHSFPNFLCMKLMRVLMSQNVFIALKIYKKGIIDKLKGLLFTCTDVRQTLVNVQIEALCVLRCLMIYGIVDLKVYKEFLPAFRYLLQWHFNQLPFEASGNYRLRMHASAVISAITGIQSSPDMEVLNTLSKVLMCCCCCWFTKAAQHGLRDISQSTLLSTCLHAVRWLSEADVSDRFRAFNDKYLLDFVKSDAFVEVVKIYTVSSIIISGCPDRRFAHPPFPNVGGVFITERSGPKYYGTQSSFILLMSFWRLLEFDLQRSIERGQKLAEHPILIEILEPRIFGYLHSYLNRLGNVKDWYLATNFFARPELSFIFKMLTFTKLRSTFEKPKVYELVYNYICWLTPQYISIIEYLFENVIFNSEFLEVRPKVLQKWRSRYIQFVNDQQVIIKPEELSLTAPFFHKPVLPRDWPYIPILDILEHFINNVQNRTTPKIDEREILTMTFEFVNQIENISPKLKIISPTEELMYLMISFMGPESRFLEKDMQELLRKQLLRFYKKYNNHVFDFDTVYEDKCSFESIYALFVDHFRGVSYGDQLFGSLVLVPLAQKYDSKWRRRVWSEYGDMLRYLNCSSELLMGGLQAYLEPPEEDVSLLKEYCAALKTNLEHPSNTLMYKIAKHHLEKYQQRIKAKK